MFPFGRVVFGQKQLFLAAQIKPNVRLPFRLTAYREFPSKTLDF